ncbi:MazG-like family protein [Clostridium sp. D2Q-14]|uniref:MazG-like family protein n=1 Tax=Anaeromonas gelatinilytica TaxID=2683194 RepID=UPI00193C282D|nr:MazG-like family protein [Anaeromonas gelatinilytica]MBS4534413.1 MazG-like family protein [Anaeromonas gelatinilytica]
MGFNNRDIDITKNIRVIEWLKSELLTTVSSLFTLLYKGLKEGQEAILEVLANIIFVTYLLAKRLGISFDEIDKKVESKVKLGIAEDHKIERWYGDLNSLLEYFKRTRR